MAEVESCTSKVIEPHYLDDLFTSIGWKPRGDQRWNRVLDRSSFVYTLWDADETGKAPHLVGMGRILEDGVMCMFYDIGVRPTYQGQGFGRKIVERLIREVAGKGYASIGLFVWEQNPGNIPFYETMGFVKVLTGMELVGEMIRE